MADLTLCSNHKTNGCTLSSSCKRATSVVTKKDKFQDFHPWNGECNSYYRDETEEERQDALNEELRERFREQTGPR